MIEERIRTLLSVEYENRLLIHEMNSFSSVFDYAQMLIDAGYEVILYDDIETFRLMYENNLRGTKAKAAIKKAFEIQIAGIGFSMVEVLSTCPTNWGMTPVEAAAWMEKNMMPYYPLGTFRSGEEVAK